MTLLDALRNATHVYVIRSKCGCPIAAITDIDHPIARKEIARDVADAIKSGLAIERMTTQQYVAVILGHTCGKR